MKLCASILALIGLATWPCIAPHAGECDLRAVDTPRHSTVASTYCPMDLGEADSDTAPTAWQGPVRVGRCTFDVGIIERPIATGSDGKLVITTYSGSEREVWLFDLKRCSTVWHSGRFTGDVLLGRSTIVTGHRTTRLDRHCEPTRGTTAPSR